MSVWMLEKYMIYYCTIYSDLAKWLLVSQLVVDKILVKEKNWEEFQFSSWRSGSFGILQGYNSGLCHVLGSSPLCSGFANPC